MADILKLLDKARRILEEEGYDELVEEIKGAMMAPEMRIKTAEGDLVAGVSKGDTDQAYVCFDDKSAGMVDLFLAEIPQGELLDLYKENEGLKEGDIRMLTWEDVHSEDYTRCTKIEASELEALREELGGEKALERIPKFDRMDENTADEICGLIEELRPSENMFIDIWSAEHGEYLNVEVRRCGGKDSFDLITSIEDGQGSYTVINEDYDVELEDLYEAVMETSCEKEQEYDYDER